MKIDRTVVICTAGCGSRLDFGKNKSLVDICGKPLIIRQMEMLDAIEDIRIVVGFQADEVMATVQQYRRDVQFIVNANWESTGTAGSLSLAIDDTRDYIVALDGDVLVHPADMERALQIDQEFIGGMMPFTCDPVLMTLDVSGCVNGFSRKAGILEWGGFAQIQSKRLPKGHTHVYHLLEPLLPIRLFEMRASELDDMDDYRRMVDWVKNGFQQ